MESPFRFGLERVRQVRAHAEEQAKEQFAASLNQRLKGEALLRAADARLTDARATSVPDPGFAVSGADLVSRQAYVERLERSRQDAQHRLVGLDRQLEASRSHLAEASRGREVLDRLRDRHHKAHKLQAERRESAALDEMALQLFWRRTA